MENPSQEHLPANSVKQQADEYYKEYQNDLTMKIDVPACTLRQLFRFADKYDVLLMVIGTLFSLGNGVSLIFYAQPFGKLVNAFAPGKDTQQIVNDALDSVKLFIINSAIVFVNSWFMSAAWSITSERQMIKARKSYFASLMNQQIAWHDRNRPAEVCSKMYIQIGKVHQGLINNVTSVLTKFSMGISGVILALIRGWQMALVMMAFLPFMAIAGFVSSYFLKQIQKFLQKTKARFDSQVIQVFDSIRTVRMLDGQKYETQRYLKKLKKTKIEDTKNGMKSKIAFASFFFCILMNYSLGFWYGSKLVADQTYNSSTNHPYTVGDVMVVFFTLYMSNLSLSGLPQSFTSFNISRVSMKRVCLMIDRVSRVKNGKQQTPKNIAKIIFDKVGFQYQKPLFINFDFRIRPGFTALIGQSGSGKTTIINLIMRFYDIFEGKVYFEANGKQHNIANLTFDSLRQRIGYVGQQPVLIGKTLKQALTAQNIPQQQIINLLKKVKAWDFVKQIGLDSQFSVLSGGQKQRIAIARALIKKPQILILDQGTSALDRTNQHQILHAIKKMQIPFVIMIAHRMQTILNADTIVKLEKGKIVAQGNYQQLVQKGILQKLIVDKQQQDSMIKSQHSQKKHKKQLQKQQAMKLIKKQQNVQQQQKQKKEQKQFKMSYIWKLMSYNKKLWYLYLIGIVASFFIGSIFPTFAYLLSNIIVTLSGIAYQKNPQRLTYYQQQVKALAISLFLISIGGLVIQILRGVSFTHLTETLGFYLKKTAFQISINKNMSQIDILGAQNLAHIITTKCQDLKHLGGYFIGDIVQNITTILIGLAIAFAFSWQITLVALAVFPLIILSGKLQMSFSQGMQSNSDKVHKKTHQAVIQSIMYIKTVKSLNLQYRIINKYQQALEQALKMAIKYGNLSGIMFGLGQTLISCLLSLIFFFGALMIKQGIVTVLNLYTAIYAIMFAGVQAGGNMLFLSRLSASKTAACHYFQTIPSQQQNVQHSVYILNNRISASYGQQPLLRKINGQIQLKNIQFKYANRQQPIFTNFNIQINAGQSVALVGQSGSGKSTITNLLFKIYDPTEGQILIDGEDINNYNISNLRRQLGIVSQQPVLFNRSVYQNIKYNCKNVSFQDVANAAKLAKAYDFIVQGNFGMKEQQNTQYSQDEIDQNQTQENMRAKVKGTNHVKIQAFNKKVGTKGSYLSGGQKQRVAIARALVRNPSVIVLDQATSALDNENQKMVQEAIEQIKGVTQIIIAHRLSTIQNCDKIVMLKKGRIIEQGKYKQLIQKQGHFYNLVNAIKQQTEKSQSVRNSSIIQEETNNIQINNIVTNISTNYGHNNINNNIL